MELCNMEDNTGKQQARELDSTKITENTDHNLEKNKKAIAYTKEEYIKPYDDRR